MTGGWRGTVIMGKTSEKLVSRSASQVAKVRTAGSIVNAVNPFQVIKDVTKAYSDYKIIREQEVTRRQSIQANKETVLREIEAKREIILTYLELSFDERETNFKKLFEVLDGAIEKDNIQVIAGTLNAITDLAKSSPFKDLANLSQVRQLTQDPNATFDF